MATPALRVVDSHALPPPTDEFGFDSRFTESMLPFFRFLHDRWWRVETDGVENVPGQGAALLAANHAGVVPWDGAMIRTALWLRHPRPRHARMLVADFVFGTPVLSTFMLRTGNVLAHPQNAALLLEQGSLVGVFPEGVRGAAKRFTDRYRVRRFGRGGFVQVAIRTGVPIIPVAVVGSEEVHPIATDLPRLGRLAGVPTFPVPMLGFPLGLLPLPSKWYISFGPPIPTAQLGPEAADEPSLVLGLSEQVRSWVQERVGELRARRTTAFF